MNDESRRTVRVIVEGRVQGVGYREFVRRTAASLGVTGWVRNRSDGGVEAALAGDGPAVAAMIAEMRRGPRWANVSALRIEERGAAATVEAGGFAVRPTV